MVNHSLTVVVLKQEASARGTSGTNKLVRLASNVACWRHPASDTKSFSSAEVADNRNACLITSPTGTPSLSLWAPPGEFVVGIREMRMRITHRHAFAQSVGGTRRRTSHVGGTPRDKKFPTLNGGAFVSYFLYKGYRKSPTPLLISVWLRLRFRVFRRLFR